MKFSALTVATLLPALAVGQEPTPISDLGARDLEKRDVSGTVLADGLRYRTCPRTSCAAIGQYPSGTPIEIQCYTRDNTTVERGDAGWALLSNGYWVAMGFQTYITWYSPIPYC